MDLFKHEDQEARERLEELSSRLEDVSSHVDAVDSALQDFVDRSSHLTRLMEEEMSMEESELQHLKGVERDEVEDRRRIEEIEEDLQLMLDEIRQLDTRQRENEKKLEELRDSELLDVIEKIRNMITMATKRFYDLEDSVEELEQRIDSLENDFMMEVNSRDFDFEKKVDRSEFESTEEELREEIEKLRASVNVMADEIDEPGISIHEMN